MNDHPEDDPIKAEIAELIKRAKKLPSHAQLDLIGLILASQPDAGEETAADEEVDTGIETEPQEFSLSFDDCLQLRVRWQPERVRELMAGIDYYQEACKELAEAGQETPKLDPETDDIPLSETRSLHTCRLWMLLPNGERIIVNQIHERLSSKVTSEIESEWTARAGRAEKRFSSEIPGHFIDNLASLVGRSFLLEEPITAETRRKIMRLFDPALSTDYKKPKVGPLQKWDAALLEQRAMEAAKTFQNPQLITLTKLAEKITELFAIEPPLTGEALRKQIGRHHMDWKEFKKRLQKMLSIQ